MLFSVDMFNEGLDVPTIDTVCCCARPVRRWCSCSSWDVAFGSSEGKTHLSAIDFIGNHKSFLSPARVLLGLRVQQTNVGPANSRMPCPSR